MELLVILLSILKVIGFILLVVLALILVIVLLILFSPICYQLAGNYTEEIGANFDVKWILGAIHIYGDYYNKDIRFSLRLFGYCVYGSDKKQKKNKKEIYTEQDTIISARSKQEEQQDKEQQQKQSSEQYTPQQNIEIEQKPEETTVEQKAKEKEERQKKETKQKHNRKKVTKPSNKKNQNKQKREKQNGKLDKSYFLHMENKKELFQAIGKFCKRMLKGVLPKHCYMEATIGTGDPAITGYILAATGAIKMKFAKGLHITGDFTQKIIKDVIVEIKGRILLAYLLYAVMRLLFVKPVRNIIMVLWKGYR